MKARKILIPLIGGIAHFAFVVGIYRIAPDIGLPIYLVAALGLEALLGLVFGFWADQEQNSTVLISACVGAFVASLGPILSSYGLALAQAPFFIINLLVLYSGMVIARKFLIRKEGRFFGR